MRISPGKSVVEVAEMVDRIKAAVDARTDPSFVIMARTDALGNESGVFFLFSSSFFFFFLFIVVMLDQLWRRPLNACRLTLLLEPI